MVEKIRRIHGRKKKKNKEMVYFVIYNIFQLDGLENSFRNYKSIVSLFGKESNIGIDNTKKVGNTHNS